MNTRTQNDLWMHSIMITLGLIVMISGVGVITMVVILDRPALETMIVAEIIVAVSLVRLLMPSLLVALAQSSTPEEEE